MTTDEIKELIHVVRDTGIAELEVHRGENWVRIRTAPAISQEATSAAPPVQVTGTPSITASPQASAEAAPTSAPAGPKEDERDVLVKSPIVGTYYDSPGPSTPSFVKVGDRVEPKQALCIIESMKLMNEIEAEIAGTVIAKHVENGRPVEYGESLFTIRPL